MKLSSFICNQKVNNNEFCRWDTSITSIDCCLTAKIWIIFCNCFEETYVGIKVIKLLQVSVKDIFSNYQLTKTSKYTCEIYCLIFQWSKSKWSECKDILILNCSCSIINFENNIVEQATAIQDLSRNRSTHLVAVAIHGSWIDVRFQPSKTWVKDPMKGIDLIIMKKFGYTKILVKMILNKELVFYSNCIVAWSWNASDDKWAQENVSWNFF